MLRLFGLRDAGLILLACRLGIRKVTFDVAVTRYAHDVTRRDA